jgi:hypothetical protein
MNEQTHKKPNSTPPDDNEIESLLSRFNPQPSTRFYTKVEKAPWMAPSNQRKRLLASNTPVHKWLLGMAVFLLICTMIGISFIPSVRVVGRQIFYSFISAPSNQIDIQATLSNTGDLYNFSDPTNFPLSIQAVQGQAGFIVKEIKRLPDDLNLVGSRFDTSYNAVTILYQGENFKLFLTQRPVGKGEDVFSIGSTAQVTLVKIGGHQGEFVVGGWKLVSTQPSPNNLTPSNQTSINAIWDSELSQNTLRWQAEGFNYELRTIGEGSPSKDELIALANELK